MTTPITQQAPSLGVIGVRGGWSSELLADKAAEVTGGPRLLIDLELLSLDLATGLIWASRRERYSGSDTVMRTTSPRYWHWLALRRSSRSSLRWSARAMSEHKSAAMSTGRTAT